MQKEELNGQIWWKRWRSSGGQFTWLSASTEQLVHSITNWMKFDFCFNGQPKINSFCDIVACVHILAEDRWLLRDILNIESNKKESSAHPRDERYLNWILRYKAYRYSLQHTVGGLVSLQLSLFLSLWFLFEIHLSIVLYRRLYWIFSSADFAETTRCVCLFVFVCVLPKHLNKNPVLEKCAPCTSHAYAICAKN